MSLVLFILSVIAMLVVLAILGAGFYSLARGGDFRKNWSNKLMRWRILSQFVALCLLVATAWAMHKGH